MNSNICVIPTDELKEILSEVLDSYFGDIRKVQQEMSSKTEEDEYLTRDEVCKRLHISTTTLWRLENDGTITSHKMGRRNLYVKKEIDAIMTSKILRLMSSKTLSWWQSVRMRRLSSLTTSLISAILPRKVIWQEC